MLTDFERDLHAVRSFKDKRCGGSSQLLGRTGGSGNSTVSRIFVEQTQPHKGNAKWNGSFLHGLPRSIAGTKPAMINRCLFLKSHVLIVVLETPLIDWVGCWLSPFASRVSGLSTL